MCPLNRAGVCVFVRELRSCMYAGSYATVGLNACVRAAAFAFALHVQTTNVARLSLIAFIYIIYVFPVTFVIVCHDT